METDFLYASPKNKEGFDGARLTENNSFMVYSSVDAKNPGTAPFRAGKNVPDFKRVRID